MKIVVLDGFSLNPGDLSWEALETLGDVVIYERTPKDAIIERAKEADVLLTNKTRLLESHFEALPKLKYIGVLATGYNIVDIEAAKNRGIIVTNVPTYGTNSVAQFVFAHLLEICHRVKEHADAVKKGKWNNHEDFCFWDHPLIELAGKTIGIIGVGNIGIQTAHIARAFGMTPIGYSPRPKPEQEAAMPLVDLETLLKSSDVISLHAPLTDETRGMLNKEAFDLMKTGVIIINTARGPLIDEDALLEALKSGKVYGAGLDVLAKEPPKAHHPFYDLDNCNVTPHIAWAPKEARARLIEIAIDNVGQFISGHPVHVVTL